MRSPTKVNNMADFKGSFEHLQKKMMLEKQQALLEEKLKLQRSKVKEDTKRASDFFSESRFVKQSADTDKLESTPQAGLQNVNSQTQKIATAKKSSKHLLSFDLDDSGPE